MQADGETLCIHVRLADDVQCPVNVRLGNCGFALQGEPGTALEGMTITDRYEPKSLLLQIEEACRTWIGERNAEHLKNAARRSVGHRENAAHRAEITRRVVRGKRGV